MGEDILSRIVGDKLAEVEAAKQHQPEEVLIERATAVSNRRPFAESLAAPGSHGVNIIAEIKRASPSKGDIRADLDPAEFSRRYTDGGAAALSVLTDRKYFKAEPEDLTNARVATSIPVLRKDFIVSTYQIYESCAMGADALLLIVRALSEQQLNDYLALSNELGIDALVEVHSEREFDIAARSGARLIGVNNRDLDTFRTDIQTCIRLADRFEPHHIGVAESGIRDRSDIERITASGIHNFLIGESLVRADNTEGFLNTLIG